MNVVRKGVPAFLLVSAACFYVSPIRADDLPEGDGKELILRACTDCHGTDRITAQRKSLDQWQQTVGRMVRRGAQLDSDEADIVSAYLFKNFSKIDEPYKLDKPAAARKSPARLLSRNIR
jgi:hypothetical protein